MDEQQQSDSDDGGANGPPGDAARDQSVSDDPDFDGSEGDESDRDGPPLGESLDAATVDDEEEPLTGPDPLRFSNWMKRSATGAVMSGISIGLREALQPTRNQPAFVMEAPGQPEDPDNPITLHFDPDNPADTVAIIRLPPAVEPSEDTPPAPR